MNVFILITLLHIWIIIVTNNVITDIKTNISSNDTSTGFSDVSNNTLPK